MNNKPIQRHPHSEIEKRVDLAHQRSVGAPLNSEVRLTLLIKHNAGLLTDVLNRTVEPFGITGVAYVAMMTLQSTPENLANPSELCVATSETRSNMTRITDELVAKGLIKRVANEQDRRRVDLSLTEAGMELLRQVVPVLRKKTQMIYSVFSEETKAAFESELIKLKQVLESPY
ncbi:MAG TPA: MarR family transcriptional regulator [Burkholderiaceae bacterium]